MTNQNNDELGDQNKTICFLRVHGSIKLEWTKLILKRIHSELEF